MHGTMSLKFVTVTLENSKNISLMEASRYAYKRNIILNSVRQHNHFITQGIYIGYMFRL